MNKIAFDTADNGNVGVVLENNLIMSAGIPADLSRNTDPLVIGPGTMAADYYMPIGLTAITKFSSIYTGKTFILYSRDVDGVLIIMPALYRSPAMSPKSWMVEGYIVGGKVGKSGEFYRATTVDSDNAIQVPNGVTLANVTAASIVTAEMGNPDLARVSIMNTLTGDRVKIQSTMQFLVLSFGAPIKAPAYYIVPSIGPGHVFMAGDYIDHSTVAIPVLI